MGKKPRKPCEEPYGQLHEKRGNNSTEKGEVPDPERRSISPRSALKAVHQQNLYRGMSARGEEKRRGEKIYIAQETKLFTNTPRRRTLSPLSIEKRGVGCL